MWAHWLRHHWGPWSEPTPFEKYYYFPHQFRLSHMHKGEGIWRRCRVCSATQVKQRVGKRWKRIPCA